MTSSPGRMRFSPSLWLVRAESATRFADEPELTSSDRLTPRNFAELLLEGFAFGTEREPEIERRGNGGFDFVGVEDAAGVRDRRLAGHERIARFGSVAATVVRGALSPHTRGSVAGSRPSIFHRLPLRPISQLCAAARSLILADLRLVSRANTSGSLCAALRRLAIPIDGHLDRRRRNPRQATSRGDETPCRSRDSEPASCGAFGSDRSAHSPGQRCRSFRRVRATLLIRRQRRAEVERGAELLLIALRQARQRGVR